jgi:NAD(P)-dependent dehydrogenase (short-subunit alcohol dehydrogenase family)
MAASMSTSSSQPPAHDTAAGPAGRAIVIGASSGIGAALVTLLAQRGWRVAALARRGDQLAELQREAGPAARGAGGELLVREHDVRDAAAVPALFEELVRQLGGLDLLVYTAGIMPKLGRTEYDTDKDLEILAINFGGLVAWGNAAAALFQTQRGGTLVGLSSISANRGRKGNPLYGASKAALDNYLESLRNRLSEVGAHVVTIKPGYVATRMTAGMDKLFWVVSAPDAAVAIMEAVRTRANERYVLRRWWIVGTVIRFIPSFVFRRLNF